MYKLEELDVGMIEAHRPLDLTTLPKLNILTVGYVNDFERSTDTLVADWKYPQKLRQINISYRHIPNGTALKQVIKKVLPLKATGVMVDLGKTTKTYLNKEIHEYLSYLFQELVWRMTRSAWRAISNMKAL